MSRPIRVAIVVSHPIQHFCPLYRALAADPRLQLKVFFASEAGARPYYDPAFAKTIAWGNDVLAGFDYEFLTPGFDTIEQSVSSARPGRALASFAPDVVQVYGYRDRLARRTLGWAILRRVPSVMVSDSELLSMRSIGKKWIKSIALPLLFRLPAAFMTIGDANEQYFQRYGVSKRRLHRSPIPIDSPGLDAVMEHRATTRSEERAVWGAGPEDVVLLAVGKSIPRKRHADVVRAMALLPDEVRSKTVLIVAGGGEGVDQLACLARKSRVNLRSLGFLSVEQLFRAYVAADVLVHPSEADPHPLAVAEAVYAGLPILVSDRVGSWGPTDDVRPGVNGLRFPVGDVSALSEALRGLVQRTDLRAALAEGSLNVGRTRTLRESALAYVEGVRAVV